MVNETRPGTLPPWRSPWSGAEARGFEPRMGANPNRISSPFGAAKATGSLRCRPQSAQVSPGCVGQGNGCRRSPPQCLMGHQWAHHRPSYSPGRRTPLASFWPGELAAVAPGRASGSRMLARSQIAVSGSGLLSLAEFASTAPEPIIYFANDVCEPMRSSSGRDARVTAGATMTITAIAADGTDVRAFDEGHGPVVLVIHPGLDDGRSWEKVAAQLSPRFRVVRIVRRHYRMDVAADGYSISREVGDVLALAEAIGEPMVVAGHSSGAVVALEALAASPGTFAGAVLFEPPVATGPPDPAGSAALARANAAVAAGKPGEAAQIFIRDIVGMPAVSARMLRLLVIILPRLRALIPRQISDLDGVGLRLDAYAQITTPAVLLGGERSPAHLAKSLDALAAVMPDAVRVTLPRRDHFAHRKAPAEVARVIEDLARRVMR